MNKLKTLLKQDHAVYEVTAWQKMLCDERIAVGGALGCAKEAVCGSIQKGLRDTDAGPDRYESIRNESDTFCRETFARLYDKPSRLEENTAAKWLNEAHDLLDAVDEFEGLKRQVRGDADFSALAAAKLMQQVSERLPGLMESIQEEGEPSDTESGHTTITKADIQRAAMRSAMRSACKDAAKEVAQTKAAMAGMMPGTEKTPPSHEQNNADRMKLAERLRDNKQLQEIMRKAGRVRRINDAQNKSKTRHSFEEVVDVERGNQLERTLPHQFVLLKNDRTRKLFLRDYAERKLLQYRLEGNEPQGRGPVVLLVDESGSMHGPRHEWARALILAAIAVARKEKRQITIVGFNGGLRYPIHKISATGEASTIFGTFKLEPCSISIMSLVLDVASRDCAGGTNFDYPLSAALALGVKEDKADLVMITDGMCDADQSTVDAIAEAKKDGLRVQGVTIDSGGGFAANMECIIDETTNLVIGGDNEAEKLAGIIGSAS